MFNNYFPTIVPHIRKSQFMEIKMFKEKIEIKMILFTKIE